MASIVSYMTEAQLKSTLSSSGNIDTAVKNDIINQLKSDGFFVPPSHADIMVDQTTDNPITIPGFVPVGLLDFSANNPGTITTTPDLYAIVSDPSSPGSNVSFSIAGSHSVVVGLSDSNTTLSLNDLGNDTVYAGSGTDSITGGSGQDQIFGGAGNDTLVAGSGADLLTAGSGNTPAVRWLGRRYNDGRQRSGQFLGPGRHEP